MQDSGNRIQLSKPGVLRPETCNLKPKKTPRSEERGAFLI